MLIACVFVYFRFVVCGSSCCFALRAQSPLRTISKSGPAKVWPFVHPKYHKRHKVQRLTGPTHITKTSTANAIASTHTEFWPSETTWPRP